MNKKGPIKIFSPSSAEYYSHDRIGSNAGKDWVDYKVSSQSPFTQGPSTTIMYLNRRGLRRTSTRGIFLNKYKHGK